VIPHNIQPNTPAKTNIDGGFFATNLKITDIKGAGMLLNINSIFKNI